jgi:hypothetical protein
VLLGIFNANFNFISVDIAANGRNSDGGIWVHSNIGKAFELGNLSVSGPSPLPGINTKLHHIIVGDEAFPLNSYYAPLPWPGTRRSVMQEEFRNLMSTFQIVQQTDKIITT